MANETPLGSVNHAEIGSLKIGSYIMMDGAPCKISKMDRSAPGKHGHAKYRLEAIGIIDNIKRSTIMSGHNKVQVPIVEKKDAQVLSVSGDKAQVMDLETYETFDLAIPEDLKGQVQANQKVLYWNLVGHKILKQIKG
jgi:translation initiation factor 5A